MGDLHHLHRVVHVPVRTLDDIARENEGRPNLFEQFRARRPSTMERIADALDSPYAVGAYVGFYAGSLFTVAAAFLWSRF